MMSQSVIDKYISQFANDNYENLVTFINSPELLTDSKYRKVLKVVLKNLNEKMLAGAEIPNWESHCRPAIEDLLNRSKLNLNALDLDDRNKSATSKTPIVLLIKSLRDNYLSYGKMILDKHKGGQHDPTFVAIPLIGIPMMKKDSKYKVWDKFIRKTRDFLDSDNQTRQAFIQELSNLETKLAELSAQYPKKSIDMLIEEVLSDFEKEANFNTLIDIPNTGKVLSPDEFNKILSDGHPFNDLGASIQHGKWSHRIQFYLLGQYLKSHVDEFFNTSDPSWKEQLGLKANEEVSLGVLSQFYRLLGSKEFVAAFDWKTFRDKRDEFNKMSNPDKQVNVRFNPSALWPQLFDRMGYGGHFSVPSSFGFLQKLGCFKGLPTLGVPNVTGDKKDKHLKTVLDLTPPINRSISQKQEQHAKKVHLKYPGHIFLPEENERTHTIAKNMHKKNKRHS